ncbi:MAG: hypothetical protein NTU61_02855 [Candidatus Altiarchaeota archaeon]|nr:hypothetical protein [Candidatus Altiarchaeota archaeon]
MAVKTAVKPDLDAVRREFMAGTLGSATETASLKDFDGKRAAAYMTQRGLELFSRGEYGNALIYFSGAVLNKPDDDGMWLNHASCLYKLGRIEDSTTSVEKAIELNPSNPMSLNLRGILHSRSGDVQKAFGCYLSAHQLQPRDQVIKTNLDDAARKLGFSQHDVNALKSAATLPPISALLRQDGLAHAGAVDSRRDGNPHINRKQLREIGNIWRTLATSKPSRDLDDNLRAQHVLGMVEGIHAIQATIQSFIDFLGDNNEIERLLLLSSKSERELRSDAGLLVSGLVNKSPSGKMNLNVKNVRMHYLGAFYSRELLVMHGDTGDLTGFMMKRGKIITEGDAGDYTGEGMADGEILVEGDAGKSTGGNVHHGKDTRNVKVKGNVASWGVNIPELCQWVEENLTNPKN